MKGLAPKASPARALATALVVLCTLACQPASTFAAGGKGASQQGALLPGANSKQPIAIEADRLDFFNKDGKIIYTGSVVVRQGDSVMQCPRLTIFLDRSQKLGETKEASVGLGLNASAGGSGMRRVEADGPVTIHSQDDVGVGDRAEYDKLASKLYLIGHVVLTQGGNVTKGNKLTYDTTTGVAVVDNGGSPGRVSGIFISGSQDADAKPGGKAQKKAARKKPKAVE